MSKKQLTEELRKKNVKPIDFNEPWFTKYAAVLLSLLVFIVYARSIGLVYTYLDDTVFILDKGPENEHLSNIFKAFTEGPFMQKDIYYRPLFRITFILERQFLFLFSKDNFYYYAIRLAHFIDILLHIISVTLLFKLLQRFSFNKTAALMWSAVYAVHPVLTMAVAWIPGRNDLMLSIFLFAYFLHFFKYLETNSRKNLVWQLFFLLLALLTKETAVFIPVVTLLYLLVFKRKELFSKNLLLIYLFWLIELAIWFLLRSHVMDPKQTEQPFSVTVSTAIERVPGLIQYIGKIFLPFNLTVYPTVTDTTYVFGIISIVALLILITLNKNRNWKMIWFGLGWFTLFILPFFFVPKKINDALYEHRLYIPLFGMLLITREALPVIIKMLGDAAKYFYAGIVIVFSVMTISYMGYFKDEITFYKKAVEDSPSSAYATKMLGIRLVYASKDAEAIPYIKKAFELDSTQMYTRYFLAKLIYTKQNDLKTSKRLLNEEIKLSPTFTENYFDLAYIAFKENDYPAMIFNLKKVLELQPGDKTVNNNLLKAYLDTKNKKDALALVKNMTEHGIEIDQVTLGQVNALPDSL